MPVARVARESGDLQPHDHADAPKTHVGDDALEAGPLGRRSARDSQVVIDDHDLVGGPTQRQSPPLQGVLPGSALLMVVHLLQGGLPHVETSQATQMARRDRGRLTYGENTFRVELSLAPLALRRS